MIPELFINKDSKFTFVSFSSSHSLLHYKATHNTVHTSLTNIAGLDSSTYYVHKYVVATTNELCFLLIILSKEYS